MLEFVPQKIRGLLLSVDGPQNFILLAIICKVEIVFMHTLNISTQS